MKANQKFCRPTLSANRPGAAEHPSKRYLPTANITALSIAYTSPSGPIAAAGARRRKNAVQPHPGGKV
jgi:hypothetical protein